MQQVVDAVKTDDSRKTLTISADLLNVLKALKQTTQFSAPENWDFCVTRPGRPPALLLHRSEAGIATGR